MALSKPLDLHPILIEPTRLAANIAVLSWQAQANVLATVRYSS